jgi:hypothetical protein
VVIRKPEITKKTSTPTKPPGNLPGQRWKMTTVVMAKALSAWMSDLSTLCSTEILPDIIPLEIGLPQSYRPNLKKPLNEETPFKRRGF